MISFGAKLKINNDIYDNITTAKDKRAVRKTVEEYKKFIQHPYVESHTVEDTIELKRARHAAGGYALELKITSPLMDEPYITGVYTNKKEPELRAGDLVYQTLLYMCFKLGEKPRILETSQNFINRVLFNGKLEGEYFRKRKPES